MKILLILPLFFFVSCATKYIVPGNRFITPEAQGESMRGQVEFQQAGANLLTINTDAGTVDDGVKYTDVTRTGFLISNSIFNQFDFVWSHTGGGNSMLGGKFQFLGATRSEKGAGHKASFAVLFGGNEHETDDESIEFELSGREYLLLYGYRISENIFPYTSFSYATYSFNGTIKSSDALNGLEPNLETTARTLTGGTEFSFESLFAKLEISYQQLETTDTKEKNHFIFGYSFGISW